MKFHSSALWNRLRILTQMCTVCGDVKQGVWNRPIVILVSLRLTGLGEEQRLDVSHLALAPLDLLALVITSDPGCEAKSCVRTCTYCFTYCLYVFTYYYTCCSMHCMRDPSRFLRYPYGAFGLTPGLDYSFVHSQVYHRDESGTGQRSECMGSRRTSDTGAD